MNPWHDISADRIKPEDFICVVEIPKDSRNKYEIDKETGMLVLDRLMTTSLRYSSNYGFIPRTLSEDGDPLDVFIVCHEEIPPLTLVRCAPIGLIEMIDNGERDEKIIAVPVYKNSLFGSHKDIKEIPSRYIDEMVHFLRTYKDLEGGKVEVKPAVGRKEAIKVIKEAMELYKKTF